MKLSNALSPLTDLRYAIGASLWPTILDIYNSPSLLFRPVALSQIVMAHIWVLFGSPTDEGARPTKNALITPNACGVVLDIGAGTSGFTLRIELCVQAPPFQVMVTPRGTLIETKSRSIWLWNRMPECTHISGPLQMVRVSTRKTGRLSFFPVVLGMFRPSLKL